jgi:hypothetical protein
MRDKVFLIRSVGWFMGAEPNSAPHLSIQPEAIYSSACRNSVFGWRNQAWLLKNSTFLKTAEIWGIENVYANQESRL